MFKRVLTVYKTPCEKRLERMFSRGGWGFTTAEGYPLYYGAPRPTLPGIVPRGGYDAEILWEAFWEGTHDKCRGEENSAVVGPKCVLRPPV